jgi:hypothetical protein
MLQKVKYMFTVQYSRPYGFTRFNVHRARILLQTFTCLQQVEMLRKTSKNNCCDYNVGGSTRCGNRIILFNKYKSCFNKIKNTSVLLFSCYSMYIYKILYLIFLNDIGLSHSIPRCSNIFTT